MLHTHRIGPEAAPTIVFLHGFLGSHADFEEVIALLCPKFLCIAIDLPGHGKSPICEDVFVALRQTLKELRAFHLVGYSMGGRIAMQYAHRFPDQISQLILLSAHPGLHDPVEREKRITADAVWADKLQTLTFYGFLQEWTQQPVFSSLQRRPKRLERLIAKKLTHIPSSPVPLLLECSLGKMPVVPFAKRTTFICGEEDLKFAELYRTLPNARAIADCGHVIPFEAPEACAQIIYNCIGEPMVFDWQSCGNYTDILYHKWDGIAKITINRPEVRNAFRPLTVDEMSHALSDAKDDPSVGVIILTGQGNQAFCSGGDQRIRGDAGYADAQGIHRLNVLDFQKQIRACPKPIVAMVAGYAIGGGHVLHVLCDLTIAADNAIFGQVGPKVGSFDGGYGASFLARCIGQKKAREVWFLCRQYNAEQALEMGLVNCVVPLEELETTTVEWCKEMLRHSPLALRCLKSALNADCDGQAGLQELAGNATLLYYMTEEAQEGHRAFLEKRTPDFSRFPKRP